MGTAARRMVVLQAEGIVPAGAGAAIAAALAGAHLTLVGVRIERYESGYAIRATLAFNGSARSLERLLQRYARAAAGAGVPGAATVWPAGSEPRDP